jgi:hypothetical protein
MTNDNPQEEIFARTELEQLAKCTLYSDVRAEEITDPKLAADWEKVHAALTGLKDTLLSYADARLDEEPVPTHPNEHGISFKEAAQRIADLKLEGPDYWKRLFQLIDIGLGDYEEPYGMYAEGDEEAPFFSEAFLYNLIGKEEARTVLALMHTLLQAGGMSLDEAHRLI